MIAKKVATLTTLCLLCLGAFAQQYYDGPSRRERMGIAVKHILALKDSNGVVLIRLQTKAAQIAVLEDAGKVGEANLMYKEQQETNKAIVKAFGDHFSWCTYYFYYADDTDRIKAKKYPGVLMDSELKEVQNPEIYGRPIYILGTGKAYLKNQGADVIGFTMMNETFDPLDKPFPYYIVKHKGSKMFEKSYEEMVIDYQQELIDYYHKARGYRPAKMRRRAKRDY